MITKIETDAEGNHLRVYHRRAEPSKVGYAWTHAPDGKTRQACTACTAGTLPDWVKKSKG